MIVENIAGDTGVSIGLIIGLISLGVVVVGGIVGVAVSRALHGEVLKRLERRLEEIESLKPSIAKITVLVRDVKEIEGWRQVATRQLTELEKHNAVQDALSSSSSTTNGTKPYRKADR